MYRFQIRAQTQRGETIGLVGSTPALGEWDASRAVHLQTGDRYPLWWADVEVGPSDASSSVEYKYVRLGQDGRVEWESWGSNRWVPIEPERSPAPIVVDDGDFGLIHPWPYGYFEQPIERSPLALKPGGSKIVVIGSSVALGCSAWLLRGWAWHLEQALHQRYGHQLVNRSALGASVNTTIDRFPTVVVPEQPDVVILALSLGNEGLASCPPQHWRVLQRRFERGLQQLLKMTRDLGARPILGSVYPHGHYSPEQALLLRETHHRMVNWGVPVLNWLDVLDDGQGRWRPGLSFDPAHPNTAGHRCMAEVIDLSLFDPARITRPMAQPSLQPPPEVPFYHDDRGFHLFACRDAMSLRVINTSPYSYTITPSWTDVQAALQRHAGLMPGVYIANPAQPGPPPSLAIGEQGTIDTTVDVPPDTDLEYRAAFQYLAPGQSQVLFYNDQLALLKESDRRLRIVNESDHEYNVHPMWAEVRRVLQAMPTGVYHDPLDPQAPFRTLMIGPDGLESRVKAPPHASILLQYQCPLSDIHRVAILPLGDRCAVRMLLYKMEYDGPAFPFDLTRTTNLADVADMIEQRFQDMWNPQFLHYESGLKRIYHTKWTGLSFAHEVEDTDHPEQDMSPVYQRMCDRYTARSERFWYTLRHCDKVLFVRTGVTDRGAVMDLMEKLAAQCQGKPFRLLLLSPQPSQEFADLPDVLHYNLEFNPDRMYDDQEHWMYCTGVMRGILDSLGVSSQNLFWCPPKPPQSPL